VAPVLGTILVGHPTSPCSGRAASGAPLKHKPLGVRKKCLLFEEKNYTAGGNRLRFPAKGINAIFDRSQYNDDIKVVIWRSYCEGFCTKQVRDRD
jgi:hypothetical protein